MFTFQFKPSLTCTLNGHNVSGYVPDYATSKWRNAKSFLYIPSRTASALKESQISSETVEQLKAQLSFYYPQLDFSAYKKGHRVCIQGEPEYRIHYGSSTKDSRGCLLVYLFVKDTLISAFQRILGQEFTIWQIHDIVLNFLVSASLTNGG